MSVEFASSEVCSCCGITPIALATMKTCFCLQGTCRRCYYEWRDILAVTPHIHAAEL